MNIDVKDVAEKLYDWLSAQKHGNEHLLHAAVCCDYAGAQHFKQALAKQLEIALKPDKNKG